MSIEYRSLPRSTTPSLDAADRVPWTREDLEQRRRRYLVRGQGGKADVWSVELPGGRDGVVKDFRQRATLWRWWGRVQIARESRILTHLRALPGVVEYLGRLDGDALVFGETRGPWLSATARQEAARCVAELEKTVAQVHQLGVVHNDLRARDNILVDARDGCPVLIDWAAGIRLRPGSLAHWLLFPALSSIDRAALLKWKMLLTDDGLTPKERRLMQRMAWWRCLWPFNRKGVGRWKPQR